MIEVCAVDDVIVPDKGKYEWIVVNPEQLIVLGSETDIEQFLSI